MATAPDAWRHPYPSQPRVPPLPLAEMSEYTRQVLTQHNLAPTGEPLALFGALARHPNLLASYLPFGLCLLTAGSLERRWTELVILRTAYHMGSRYVWNLHVATSLAIGLDRATIERVMVGPSADGWSPVEGLLMQATDELHRERSIVERTWDALAQHLDEMQLIELCFLVGQYEMLAMFVRTAGLQLEPGEEPPFI
jgi:4-carboxymuconolactone decarboxylase